MIFFGFKIIRSFSLVLSVSFRLCMFVFFNLGKDEKMKFLLMIVDIYFILVVEIAGSVQDILELDLSSLFLVYCFLTFSQAHAYETLA